MKRSDVIRAAKQVLEKIDPFEHWPNVWQILVAMIADVVGIAVVVAVLTAYLSLNAWLAVIAGLLTNLTFMFARLHWFIVVSTLQVRSEMTRVTRHVIDADECHSALYPIVSPAEIRVSRKRMIHSQQHRSQIETDLLQSSAFKDATAKKQFELTNALLQRMQEVTIACVESDRAYREYSTLVNLTIEVAQGRITRAEGLRELARLRSESDKPTAQTLLNNWVKRLGGHMPESV